MNAMNMIRPNLKRTLLGIVLVALAGAQPLQASTEIPIVKLAYAEGFDTVCAQQAHYTIQPAWVDELHKRLPEFSAEWKHDGEPLLDAVEEIAGKPFRDKEFIVWLSVCSFPSMSDPLLVNARFSLKSFTADNLSPDVTISIILHELLHHYLSGRIPPHSRLLTKYSNEDSTVRTHLHMFALMEAAYVKLGETATLDRVIAKDRELPNRSYGRAWDIVQSEGYSAFIAELK